MVKWFVNGQDECQIILRHEVKAYKELPHPLCNSIVPDNLTHQIQSGIVFGIKLGSFSQDENANIQCF